VSPSSCSYFGYKTITGNNLVFELERQWQKDYASEGVPLFTTEDNDSF
jgi:hypothetical protein